MRTILRVWWHCLWRTFSRVDHRMVSVEPGGDLLHPNRSYHFCLCGYLAPSWFKRALLDANQCTAGYGNALGGTHRCVLNVDHPGEHDFQPIAHTLAKHAFTTTSTVVSAPGETR